MDENEETIKENFESAKQKITGLRSGFDKKVYANGLREIWTAFDTLLKWRFSADRQKFSQLYQLPFEKWDKTSTFTKNLDELRKLGPVKDMDIRHNRPPTVINDPNNLFQILQHSYRIRSNLTHGPKVLGGNSPESIRNRALVEYSFIVTFEILENVLRNEKII